MPLICFNFILFLFLIIFFFMITSIILLQVKIEELTENKDLKELNKEIEELEKTDKEVAEEIIKSYKIMKKDFKK